MKKHHILLLTVLILIMTCLSCTCALADADDDYEDAISLLRDGAYAEAAKAFDALDAYADAPRYAMYARALAQAETGAYDVAISAMTNLGSFLDCPQRILYYKARQYEAAENYSAAGEIYLSIPLYLDSAARMQDCMQKFCQQKYARADQLEQAGKLQSALELFADLSSAGYLDSAARAASLRSAIQEQECRLAYEAADAAETAGKLETAYEGFLALSNYLDAAARAERLNLPRLYQKGQNLVRSGSYAKAYDVFAGLGDYQNSTDWAYALKLSTYAKMSKLTETEAKFEFHEKTGLVNFDKLLIVPPQWTDVSLLSADRLKGRNTNGSCILDLDGNKVLNKQFEDISVYVDGLCAVAVKDTVRSTKYNTKYRFGLVDTDGKFVTEATWYTLGGCHDNYTAAPRFNSQGLIIVSNEKGYGLMNRNGELVVQPIYDEIRDFSNGFAAAKRNKKWGFLDASGTEVIPPVYTAVEDFRADGTADVQNSISWQIISTTGEKLYFIPKKQEKVSTTRLNGQNNTDILLPEGVRLGMTWSEITTARPEAYIDEFTYSGKTYSYNVEDKLSMFGSFTAELTYYLKLNEDSLIGLYYLFEDATAYEAVQQILLQNLGNAIVIPEGQCVSAYINTGDLYVPQDSEGYLHTIVLNPGDAFSQYLVPFDNTFLLVNLDLSSYEYEDGTLNTSLSLTFVALSEESLGTLSEIGILPQ